MRRFPCILACLLAICPSILTGQGSISGGDPAGSEWSQLIVTLIPLILGGLLIYLALFSRKLRSCIMKLSEAKSYILKNSGRVFSTNIHISKFNLKLPFLGSLTIITIAAAVFVASNLLFGMKQATVILSWSYFSICYIFILASLVLHFRPNSRRDLKYFFLLNAFLLLWIFQIFNPLAKSQYPGNTIYLLLVVIISLLALFYAMAVLIGKLLYGKNASDKKTPIYSMRIFYGIIRSTGIPFLVLCCIFFPAPFAILYLLLRFVTTEYMKMYPIVFLRSFDYASSNIVYSEIIGPVAAKFGVIVGLVHGNQKGSELFASTHMANQGYTYTIPDSLWKEWVEEQLSHCSAVIIDSSILTESVMWELQSANNLLGRGRVVILDSEDNLNAIESENIVIHYGVKKTSMRNARKMLGQNLEMIFKSPNPFPVS